MRIARRPLGRAVLAITILLAAMTAVHTTRAAEKARLTVQDYVIDAVVNPATHKLTAKATVKFTAQDDLSTASFELHNALRPTKVTDGEGHVLAAERVTQDSTVRVALPSGMTKGQEGTLTFEYEGVLNSAEDSPVQGLKLASIADPISYLLYSGRWFPMVGYNTNRFTSTIHVTVPQGYTAIGSGDAEGNPPTQNPATAAPAPAASTETPKEQSSDGIPVLKRRTPSETKTEAEAPATKSATAKSSTRKKAGTKATAKSGEPKASEAAVTSKSLGAGTKTYTFTWTKTPSFPGTIVIGRFTETTIAEGAANVHVYFTADKKSLAQQYGETASKEFSYFTTLYGVPLSPNLKIVQLPDDTMPASWAPEMAAIAGRAISGKQNYRLLANTVAHQWWGVDVSAASRDDFWLTEGASRYTEARYIEFAAGRAGEEEAVKDMSVGALAYDSVPLSQIGTLDTFDPVFQSMTTDKGGMIFHMLRWVLGDQKYDQAMRNFLAAFAGKPAALADFRDNVQKSSGEELTWFFSQWLDSTGAPEFKNKYTIYRTGKGFRLVGEISQDLDLFRMPVQIKIDTDGKTEDKVIDVVGTNSAYSVDTFGKPRRIAIDPNNWVLKNSGDLKIRTAILRGQQMVAQGNLAESLREFQKALDVNKNSSLAHYRIAEVFYLQKNYQAAANAYRDALNGDGDPRWTEVWSHVQLGKIFDVTGQRERALNEYQKALQTNDNTQGALDEARRNLQKPYTPEKTQS
jgi:Peptidase family M1 domain